MIRIIGIGITCKLCIGGFRQIFCHCFTDKYNKPGTFTKVKATPLLVIHTSDIDFVERVDDLNELVTQIEHMEKGVQYYIPLGAGDGPRRKPK